MYILFLAREEMRNCSDMNYPALCYNVSYITSQFTKTDQTYRQTYWAIKQINVKGTEIIPTASQLTTGELETNTNDVSRKTSTI